MENKNFYPEPFSIPHIMDSARIGILFISSIAVLSSITTIIVLAVLVRRLVFWRTEYRRQIRQNQCMVLILNLFLADSIMALGGKLGFKWIQAGAILAPTGWCWTQGALLQLGDLTSACFVIALALQTKWTFDSDSSISRWQFRSGVAGIWIASISFTIIGPALVGADYYVNTGDWCWISQKYSTDRIVFNYLWIFLSQLVTLLIYGRMLYQMYKRLSHLRSTQPSAEVPERLAAAMRSMALYPLAYLAMSFPLALTRMQGLAGQTPSNVQVLVAGGLVASYGWVDAVLYSFARRILVHTSPEDEGGAHIRQGIEMEPHISSQ